MVYGTAAQLHFPPLIIKVHIRFCISEAIISANTVSVRSVFVISYLISYDIYLVAKLF